MLVGESSVPGAPPALARGAASPGGVGTGARMGDILSGGGEVAGWRPGWRVADARLLPPSPRPASLGPAPLLGGLRRDLGVWPAPLLDGDANRPVVVAAYTPDPAPPGLGGDTAAALRRARGEVDAGNARLSGLESSLRALRTRIATATAWS